MSGPVAPEGYFSIRQLARLTHHSPATIRAAVETLEPFILVRPVKVRPLGKRGRAALQEVLLQCQTLPRSPGGDNFRAVIAGDLREILAKGPLDPERLALVNAILAACEQ